MESRPVKSDVSDVNLDVSAVNSDTDAVNSDVSAVNSDTVTVPKQYLEFLEQLTRCKEEPPHCEEMFIITVNNNKSLRKLLVRQDVKDIQDDQDINTQFYNIFYSDVTIEHRSEYTEKTKKKLIKWYLNGCKHLKISDEASAIYIQNCELKSTSSNAIDTYYYGCYSEYFIHVTYLPLPLYNLYIDLKKSNRLSDPDCVNHIMATY